MDCFAGSKAGIKPVRAVMPISFLVLKVMIPPVLVRVKLILFLIAFIVSKPKATGGGRKMRNYGVQIYSLRSEVQEVRERSEELLRTKDHSEYCSWVAERQEAVRLQLKAG